MVCHADNDMCGSKMPQLVHCVLRYRDRFCVHSVGSLTWDVYPLTAACLHVLCAVALQIGLGSMHEAPASGATVSCLFAVPCLSADRSGTQLVGMSVS